MKVLQADLVVVGGGLAGVTTAVRANELGLRTLLLEQSSDQAGWSNSRMSGARYHAAGLHPASRPATIASRVATATGGFAEPALTESWANNCGRSYAWLRAHGVRFVMLRGVPVMAPIRPNRRGEVWSGYGSDVAVRRLLTLFRARGGLHQIGLRAVETGLSAGRVSSVVARSTRPHSDLRIEAANVVIADGGFQANLELLRSYAGVTRPDLLLQRGAGTGMGDGLMMALSAGGHVIGGEALYAHLVHREAAQRAEILHYPMLDALAAASTVVDGTGRRFCEESLGGIAIANRLARHADPASAWVVFDKHAWTSAGREAQVVPPNPNLLLAGARIESGRSPEELAGKMNMPIEPLRVSLGERHGTGAGPDQDRRLFAAPIAVGLTFTMGGIAISPHAQVLTADRVPIEGLYAAGTATGGLSGGSTPAYVGGISIAATLGLLAAEHVAARKTSPGTE